MKTRCQSLALRTALEYAEQITIIWNLDDDNACNFDYFPEDRILIKNDDFVPTPWGGEGFLSKNLEEKKHVWKHGFNSQLKKGERTLSLFVGQTSINRFTHDERRQQASATDHWILDQIKSCEQGYRAYHREFPPPYFWHHKRWSDAYKRGRAQLDEWEKRRRAHFNKIIHPPLLGALGILIKEFGDCSSYTVFGNADDKNEYVSWRRRNLNHPARKLQGQKRLEADLVREWPSIAAQLAPYFRCDSGQLKAVERAVAKGRISTRAARQWLQKHHLLNRLNDGIRAEKRQQPKQQIAA